MHDRDVDSTTVARGAPVGIGSMMVVAAPPRSLQTIDLADYVDEVERRRRFLAVPLVLLPLASIPAIELLPSWLHFVAWGVACVVLTVLTAALMNVPETVARDAGLVDEEAAVLAGLLDQARRGWRGPSRAAVVLALTDRVAARPALTTPAPSPTMPPPSA